ACAARVRGSAPAHRSFSGETEGKGNAADAKGHFQGAAPRCRRDGRQLRASPRLMLIVGLDVGSNTVKASVSEGGTVRWQDYKRHNTKQAEMVLEFLGRIEAECGLTPGRDRIF